MLLADATFSLPFSRGRLSFEDVHFDGGKFGTQATNTFAWDNIGFDGPSLGRDLTFDVPDNLATYQTSDHSIQVGYGSVALLTMPQVADLGAAAVSLRGDLYLPCDGSTTFTYALDNHAPHALPWPGPAGACGYLPVTIPLDPSELTAGLNTLIFPDTNLIEANLSLALTGPDGAPLG
ncbi:MAG TPA: hypothetical protein VNL71_24885 [Chloroflexota bacterium]|nr:hypothetical protein [Chloroflexota bacterium]